MNKLGIKNIQFDGIITSPPYVGIIDYHEQHKYSYELLHLKRNDNLEIGPAFNGKSKKAQNDYINGMVQSLKNIKQFCKPEARFIIIANDRLNLYPRITESAGFKIIQHESRPVYKRSSMGGAKSNYAESIYHLVSDPI